MPRLRVRELIPAMNALGRRGSAAMVTLALAVPASPADPPNPCANREPMWIKVDPRSTDPKSRKLFNEMEQRFREAAAAACGKAVDPKTAKDVDGARALLKLPREGDQSRFVFCDRDAYRELRPDLENGRFQVLNQRLPTLPLWVLTRKNAALPDRALQVGYCVPPAWKQFIREADLASLLEAAGFRVAQPFVHYSRADALLGVLSAPSVSDSRLDLGILVDDEPSWEFDLAFAAMGRLGKADSFRYEAGKLLTGAISPLGYHVGFGSGNGLDLGVVGSEDLLAVDKNDQLRVDKQLVIGRRHVDMPPTGNAVDPFPLLLWDHKPNPGCQGRIRSALSDAFSVLRASVADPAAPLTDQEGVIRALAVNAVLLQPSGNDAAKLQALWEVYRIVGEDDSARRAALVEEKYAPFGKGPALASRASSQVAQTQMEPRKPGDTRTAFSGDLKRSWDRVLAEFRSFLAKPTTKSAQLVKDLVEEALWLRKTPGDRVFARGDYFQPGFVPYSIAAAAQSQERLIRVSGAGFLQPEVGLAGLEAESPSDPVSAATEAPSGEW